MTSKIVIGPVNRGLRTDREPFNIDDDSFPVLINAYQWRGRVKRKRGTSLLGRLTRFFKSTSPSYNPGAFLTPATFSQSILLDATGAGNILDTFPASSGFPLEFQGNIVPGSVTLTSSGGPVFTDPTKDGFLTPTGTGGPNTIDYSSGQILIPAQAGNTITAVFSYMPDLPVMGLEDISILSNQFPGTIAFDTKYSYNVTTSAPYSIYDVSFYKNPAVDGTNLPGYIPKTNPTPTTWNGQDYQQFWTTNFQGAFWATNGINIPFSVTNIGMQFKPIVTITVTAGGPPAIATLQITGHGLVVGDFLFINEVASTTGINFQSGYVIAVVDANNVSVEFPFATIATNGTGGIAQYLTNRSDITKDCLRWYDGDPTNGNATTPTLNQPFGWVNFCPPLSQSSFSIDEKIAAQYYLVGARMIFPFKDRLLFIGPVIQSSSGQPLYLQDTVIYSQNGTPFYTASYTNKPTATTDNPTSPLNIFHPILVPANQTSSSAAYIEDQTGFGGFVSAGLQQAIVTTSVNQDVLIMGFDNNPQVKLVYTGNDVVPFNFFLIDSELSSSSTFSAINLGKGVITRGNNGYIITTQVDATRIDPSIPDQVFEISLINNGSERMCAQRDYINEWIYFTYPSNQITYKFPNQTLLYNYRDNSWAIFNECYTTYGQFRKLTGYTWATIGQKFASWSVWNEPWNTGTSTLLQPEVIAGNQQGFVFVREQGTNEADSLTIDNISFPSIITGVTQANPAVITSVNNFVPGQRITISGVVGMTNGSVTLNGQTVLILAATPTTITIQFDTTAFTPYISGGIATPQGTIYSKDHCLNENDFINISGALGSISSQVNNFTFQVISPITNDTFNLTPNITSGTYFGGGLIQRLYIPFIQTKQFPVAWGASRKTRIGVQQYLLSTTEDSQIQLLIYLSQNASSPYNTGSIIPDISNLQNSALIYSTVLFTCPESTNLGLTASNVNLNMPTAIQQAQIWHRINTSLIGDSVQLALTISPNQMSVLTQSGPSFVITGASQTNPCVIQTTGMFPISSLIQISGVLGMTQLNTIGNQAYNVLSSNSTSVTIDVNATGFGMYTSGGIATPVDNTNQLAEVEFHGCVIDATPSMMLS